MSNKKDYGQFYTKKSYYIIENLLKDLPEDVKVIEPFVGEGDLLIFDNPTEIYDIDPKIDNTIHQDTLLNPPNYSNSWVVTNPPYLAKNKNKNKTLYELWNVDDLYKAFLKSIHECSGGIVIIPLNFLSEEDNAIRNYFFTNFKILNLNIFEEQVFDDTSYTVISFSFIKNNNNDNNITIEALLKPSNTTIILNLNKDYGYRIGDEYHEIIINNPNIGIKRLMKPEEGRNFIPNSKIFLRAIDTGTMDGRISLSIRDEEFYGISTDRVFATLILHKELTIEQQEVICKEFNELLEFYRKKYNSLFMTNYRNSTELYARKRISFDDVYKLVSYIITKNNY